MLSPVEKTGLREKILDVEEIIKKTPGAMLGDCFPLKHTFADGFYIREIFMPKGYFIVSKIHKYEHPYFVLQGDVSVLTEDGIKRIKAPYSGITPVGTKRILYIHEDCVWTTIHTNPDNGTDLEEIEERVIAKSFDEVLPGYAIKFIEGLNPCLLLM